MDRLDYLKRDSFYTGVAEGNINSDRLLTMLNVHNGQLVVEEKGIYSVEKFIVARRLMYWGVYLHKTGLVAEKIMEKILLRAKALTQRGVSLPTSDPLFYFLKTEVSSSNFDSKSLLKFAQLDDYDLMAAVKAWVHVDDKVLSLLSKSLIDRILPRIEIQNNPFEKTKQNQLEIETQKALGLDNDEISYFVFGGRIENQAYDSSQNAIDILYKTGEVKDLTEASDNLNIKSLDHTISKYYICYPKNR
jgi:HD superfamily phosphohydrolase